jgi:hypothetical protein
MKIITIRCLAIIGGLCITANLVSAQQPSINFRPGDPSGKDLRRKADEQVIKDVTKFLEEHPVQVLPRPKNTEPTAPELLKRVDDINRQAQNPGRKVKEDPWAGMDRAIQKHEEKMQRLFQ